MLTLLFKNDVTYCNTTYSQSKCYWNRCFKTVQNKDHFNYKKNRNMLPLAQLFDDRAVAQKYKGPVWPKASVRFFTRAASRQRTRDM